MADDDEPSPPLPAPAAVRLQLLRVRCADDSKGRGKLVALVLFEQLPVIIPKIHPVVYVFQELSFRWRQQYRRQYPNGVLGKADARLIMCLLQESQRLTKQMTGSLYNELLNGRKSAWVEWSTRHHTRDDTHIRATWTRIFFWAVQVHLCCIFFFDGVIVRPYNFELRMGDLSEFQTV